MNRRGFLGSMLALGAAPAIVSSESLMRVFAPPTEIVVPTMTELSMTYFSRTREEAIIALIQERMRNMVMDMEKQFQASLYA